MPLPDGRSLWIFGDTRVYAGSSGQMAMTQFITGATAAEGPSTPGLAPTGLMEVPNPGQGGQLSAQNPPAQFVPPPTNLYLPDGSGRSCGFDLEHYPARWVTGAALIPGTSEVLVIYVDACVSGTWQFTFGGLGFMEYDWQTNSITEGPFDTFAPTQSGSALPPDLVFGNPVIHGGNVTLFSSVCTELYGACGAGRVDTTTFPVTLAALKSPASYTPSPAVTDASASWTPAGISVASYGDSPYRMIEATAVDGSYAVLTASAPAGPWHLETTGQVPGCQGLVSGFCYSLVGHPELSDSAGLMITYYDPGAGPQTPEGPGGHVVATWVGLGPTSRVYGQDAIDTSIAVSQATFPGTGAARGVVLAQSNYFSDGLAGGPLAAQVRGPLLITPGASVSQGLDPRVRAEIQRVLPSGGKVYTLGGPVALSPSIDTTLRGLGYSVQRVAGPTQYATAVAIAGQLGDPSTVFETTGLSFYDSLSAVPAVIGAHGAILLTNGNTEAPETAAYLAAHPSDTRYTIGGPLAAAGADPMAGAVWGQDAYGTSAAVGSRFFPSPSSFGAATSADFPDALSAGPMLGEADAPMLLVPSSGTLPGPIHTYLSGAAGGIISGTVFGGPFAVGEDVLAQLNAIA